MPPLREVLQPYSAVVLTGGSSGIGKSFIRLGAKLKPDVVFCNLSRRHPDENILSNSPKSLNHLACDLTRPVEVERAAAGVRDILARDAASGKILLINNSGFGAFDAFRDLDLSRELTMIDLNVRAVVHLTGLLLPLLLERGGAIINVASTVAFQPTPFAATYGASKAFVLHWTVALNEELRGSGVHALAVCPGTTRTEFFRVAGAEIAGFGAGMSPDDVAAAAFRALAARKSLVVPGLGNKLYTFAGSRSSKPFAAKVARRVLEPRRSRRTQS